MDVYSNFLFNAHFCNIFCYERVRLPALCDAGTLRQDSGQAWENDVVGELPYEARMFSCFDVSFNLQHTRIFRVQLTRLFQNI